MIRKCQVNDTARMYYIINEAARAYVTARLNLTGIDSISWRDARHEGHRGWYRIEGFMDVVDIHGDDHSFFYMITVIRQDGDDWDMEDLKLTPMGKENVGE